MLNGKGKNIEKIVRELGIKTTRFWSEYLGTLPAHQLGVVKVSGKLLTHENIWQLCSELAYLAGEGFYLPIVFGGGVQYDAFGESRKVNNIRVTSKGLIEMIAEECLKNQKRIVTGLETRGVPAVPIGHESIVVQPHGVEYDADGIPVDTGFIGDVVSIDTKGIISAIMDNRIPVLSHLGVHKGQPYNVNATTLAKELVKYLGAKKLVIVGDTPIMDSNGGVIKTIYSEMEFKGLVQSGVISGGMVVNGREAYDLLNHLGPGHTVQITSLKGGLSGDIVSTGLLEELLGNGTGTCMVAPFVITAYPLEAVDIQALSKLVSDIFLGQGKILVPTYFDDIREKNATVYLDEKQRGGAITYPMDGFEYICKVFVHEDYEGLGIATSIFETVLFQKGAIGWRGAHNNKPTIERYDRVVAHYNGKRADGEKYAAYMMGVPEKDTGKVAESVLSVPPTMARLVGRPAPAPGV